MPDPLRERLEEHNRRQRSYFERTRKRTMEPARTPYVRRQVDEVMRAAHLAPSQHVLEVGCGMGRHTLALAESGVQVEGLDLSPVLLERLRRSDGGRYNIPLHCGDVLQPPPELEGRFDAVVGFFTLHHLHDVGRCLEAMVRLIRPGGRLAFLEPNPYCALYYVQILVTPGMTWKGDGGMIRMRKRVIFSAMREAGLQQPTLWRFGFFPPFLANRPWGGRLERHAERFPPFRPFLPFQIFAGSKPEWPATATLPAREPASGP